MKLQLLLAACLLGAAFAAPVPEYIDPDCIEEEFVDEEPAPEIEAEFALGLPDLKINFNNEPAANDECEDEIVATEPAPTTEAECEDETIPPTEPEPTEAECEDEPIPTEPVPTEPVQTTEAECEDEPIVTEEPADECEEEANFVDSDPILKEIIIEPAMVEANPIMISEEKDFPVIEECEE